MWAYFFVLLAFLSVSLSLSSHVTFPLVLYFPASSLLILYVFYPRRHFRLFLFFFRPRTLLYTHISFLSSFFKTWTYSTVVKHAHTPNAFVTPPHHFYFTKISKTMLLITSVTFQQEKQEYLLEKCTFFTRHISKSDKL